MNTLSKKLIGVLQIFQRKLNRKVSGVLIMVAYLLKQNKNIRQYAFG